MPEAFAAQRRARVRAEPGPFGKCLEELGVPAPADHLIDDAGGGDPLDDIADVPPPAALAVALERGWSASFLSSAPREELERAVDEVEALVDAVIRRAFELGAECPTQTSST